MHEWSRIVATWCAAAMVGGYCAQTFAQNLTLNIVATSISENAGTNATTATVSRSGSSSGALAVALTNSDPTEVSFPAVITIPSGQLSANFAVASVNDGEIDGTQSATITASAAGFTSGADSVDVTDDDTAGARTIGGKLNGVLASNSYRVTFELAVDAGQTLTIEPGTNLRFDTNVALVVAGALIADAGPASEIVFTSSAGAPVRGNWRGIRVTNSGGPRTVLDHVEVAFAVNGVWIPSNGPNPQVTIRESEVRECSGSGIVVAAGPSQAIDSSEVQILSNRVHHNNFAGIHLLAFCNECNEASNAALVSGNDIHHNSVGVNLYADNGVFFCIPARVCPVSSRIEDNFIHDNGNGIVSGTGFTDNTLVISPTILNNLVVANTNAGLNLLHGNEVLTAQVLHNTILQNGGAGIRHDNLTEAGFAIRNNVVADNGRGIEADAAFTNSVGAVGFNDVVSNSPNWVHYPAGFGVLTTTNANGTPADFALNISLDPVIGVATNGHLAFNSPCINAGTNLPGIVTDFDGEPRPAGGTADIGADEFQPPPQLMVSPSYLDFGTLVAGQSTNLSFQLRNVGGLTATGTATVPAPFSIVGGGSYSVVAGTTGLVTVGFNPNGGGSFSNLVVFGGTGGGSTNPVAGGAMDAFVELVPTLVSGPTNGGTGGSIVVTNAVQNTGTVAVGTTFKLGVHLSTDAVITTNDVRIGERNVSSLNPGETTSATTGATIPVNVPAGSYFLGLIADYGNVVTESNELNNALAGNPISVTLGTDLLMTAVAGPTNGSTGASILITNAVHNAGVAPSGSSMVGFYLSSDAVITTNDLFLGGRSLPGLAAAQTNTSVDSVFFGTNVAPGAWFLGAIADYANEVAEFNETNNARAGNAIQIRIGPDFLMTQVGGSTTGGTSGTIVITNTIANVGTGNISGIFTVGLYLSSDGVITTNDLRIRTRNVVGLAAGQTNTAATSVPISNSVPMGTYFLGAIADSPDMVAEFNEANNALAGNAIEIRIGPDLIATTVAGPTNASTGAFISITNAARNVGIGSAGPFSVGLYLSTDATITTNDLQVGTDFVSGLAEGQTSTNVASVFISTNVPPGPYFLGAIADSVGQIVEFDETNNALAGNPVQLRIGPDFIMSHVRGPTNVTAGTSIPVTNTIVNIGTGRITGIFNVGLYLSSDSMVTTNDLRIGIRNVLGLDPGQSNTTVNNVTISNSVPMGTYFLGAVADYSNLILEFDEANNGLTGNTIDVQVPAVASFHGAPTGGMTPLTVAFNDMSTGTISNRFWNFGDGTTTNTLTTNVVHTYDATALFPAGDINGDGLASGADSLLINQALVGLRDADSPVFQTSFTVRLIAQGPAGTSTNTQPDLIALGLYPNGDLNQDGEINQSDTLLINHSVVGIRSYLITRIVPDSRSAAEETAVTIFGVGIPTNTISEVRIGPPVNLVLTNVLALSDGELQAVIPAGGGGGTGTVEVIAFPSNSVISFATFENE